MIGIEIVAGLCNRMFQFAYAYSISRKHNLEFRLENWERRSHHSPQIYEWLIQRFTNLPNYVPSPVTYTQEIKEEPLLFTHYTDHYTPDMVTTPIKIYGFFQNENYFKEYRSDLLKLFKEPEFITEHINKNYKVVLPYLEKGYFLHIRLGDYVRHPKHWVHLEKYYINALETVSENPIIVFTNDWKSLPRVYPSLYQYLQTRTHICVRDYDEVVSLYLMSRCKLGGICCNSTFGWWGGWLNTNPNKKLYFPSQWLSDSSFKSDIYPEGSIVVSV